MQMSKYFFYKKILLFRVNECQSFDKKDVTVS